MKPPLQQTDQRSTQNQDKPIIFFDGVCHLCNGFVDFVISKDQAHQFLFAPLQGSTAEKHLSEKDRKSLESVILFSAEKTYHKSLAVILILGRLGFPFNLLLVFRIIPAFLRDFIYSYIAKNRYSWFGEKDSCRLPLPHEREYLLP